MAARNTDPYRGIGWGEVNNESFPHGLILLPKQGAQSDEDEEAFAPAAMERTQAAVPVVKKVRYIPPPRTAQSIFTENLGYEPLKELRSESRRIPSPNTRGMYASFDRIGAAAVFTRNESDLDEVRAEVEQTYDVYPDFQLSIPYRVADTRLASSRSLKAPSLAEWPDISGVALAHGRGIRGAGVLVGVLDTGVDADHQEFLHHTINYRYVSLQPNSPFWPPRDVRGFDTDGHGTHVCGIIAGKNVGVAPEVKLYVASVIESETIATSMSRVVAGLDWLFRQFSRPDNEHLPAVLNLSLGFPGSLSSQLGAPSHQNRLNLMKRLIRTLRQANVLPLVAIGNDGANTWGFPGAFPDVLAVGAVDFNTQVADFSGGGTISTGLTKPDLVGFGVEVNSAIERDYYAQSVYRRLSGTSMATPYVAGIAALYRSAYPGLTVDQIQARLLENILELSGGVTRVGAGLARFHLPNSPAVRSNPSTKSKRAKRVPKRN